MSIRHKTEDGQPLIRAKRQSDVSIYHFREPADLADELMFKQHGGTSIAFTLERLNIGLDDEEAGDYETRILFRVGIAMCRHDEMFSRKTGAKLAKERLAAGTDPYVITGLLPSDNRALVIGYLPDGNFYIHDESQLDLLDFLEEQVDVHLSEHVWPNIYSNPHNPLDDMEEDGPFLSDEAGVARDPTEDDFDDTMDDSRPVLLVVGAGALTPPPEEDEEPPPTVKPTRPLTH